MSYQFAGSLYHNERSMLDAIAESWLSTGGIASIEEQRVILAEEDDETLMHTCIVGWELHLSHTPDDCDAVPSHMAKHNYNDTDLLWAFRRLRERLLLPAEGA